MTDAAERKAFKDSHETAYRRLMRGAVRKGLLTKGERDVTMALLNVWFHHRNGPKKFIHPSRAAIAKKAGVSEKTVSRTLYLLRSCGALIVMSDLRGGHHRATRYRFDDLALLVMCGLDIEVFNAAMTGKNAITYRDICPAKNRQNTGTKCPTVYKTVEPLFEGGDFAFPNVVPMLRRQGGGNA